jgi:hypothetical protein
MTWATTRGVQRMQSGGSDRLAALGQSVNGKPFTLSLTKADSGAEETQRNHQATIRLLSGYLRLPGPPSGGDMRDAAEPTTTATPGLFSTT